MKYITIPADIEVPITVDQAGTSRMYSYQMHLDFQVWTHEFWRSGDLNAASAYWSLREKFSEKKPGDVVALDDKEYEMFKPLCCLATSKVNKDMSAAINHVSKPVIFATHEDPRKPVEKKN